MTMFRFLMAKHGPIGYAIFGGGVNSGATAVSTTEKWLFVTSSTATGSALNSVRREHGSASNHKMALFGGGSTSGATASSTTSKYLWQDESTSSSATLGTARIYVRATSNQEKAIFGHASTSAGANISTTDKVIFATEINSSGGNLTTSKSLAGECSSSEKGVFAGGAVDFTTSPTMLKTVDLYTYSTDTSSGGGDLVSVRRSCIGASCKIYGLLALGAITTISNNTNTSERYNFPSYSSQNSVTLSVARRGHGAASYDAKGVWGGGYSTTEVATVDLFVWSSESVSTSTSLSNNRSQTAAASSTPGHL